MAAPKSAHPVAFKASNTDLAMAAKEAKGEIRGAWIKRLRDGTQTFLSF